MNHEDDRVVPPPDAVHLDDWETRHGERFRFFRGSRWGRRVTVEIVGFQYADGRVDKRVIHLNADNVDLDRHQAALVIADLTAAADELDRLSR